MRWYHHRVFVRNQDLSSIPTLVCFLGAILTLARPSNERDTLFQNHGLEEIADFAQIKCVSYLHQVPRKMTKHMRSGALAFSSSHCILISRMRGNDERDETRAARQQSSTAQEIMTSTTSTVEYAHRPRTLSGSVTKELSVMVFLYLWEYSDC